MNKLDVLCTQYENRTMKLIELQKGGREMRENDRVGESKICCNYYVNVTSIC
jgi:hypothetical protein